MPSNNSTATRYEKGDTAQRVSTIAATGTLTQCAGVVSITAGSAIAVTLPVPVAGADSTYGDDGKELTIISETAYAHTVALAGKLNGGAKGTATFGAAAGNNVTLVARNGYWWVKSSVGATLS